ncbi:MAG: SUMF1/EgtB/PvdO family nonheme iron enzyme [Bacteroidales bacterium]
MKFISRILILLGVMTSGYVHAQTIHNAALVNKQGLSVNQFKLSDSSTVTLKNPRPLFTFVVNGKDYSSDQAVTFPTDSGFVQVFNNGIKTVIKKLTPEKTGWNRTVTFRNESQDTMILENVVPFGTLESSAYITGKGPWDLARAWLFRPGFRPVRVILPDNAWELGYSSFTAGKNSFCGLARRQKTTGQKRRYETMLPPGTQVVYNIYCETFTGDWQAGLRLMFRDRYLYDLDKFDNSLFERPDLQWIKKSYIIILQMAWDREFFDRSTGKYTYAEELKNWNTRFGHIDVFGIWPTWPRLGLDQRNQWDMYRDLPGGTNQLKTFARMSRQYDTKFFIAYNPWDNSTRKEDHYRGMAQLIEETEADGVVLDTRGSSSFELQAAADSVRKGVVMFSEGMAITRDMPGIIAGRVHNAIYFSPELNLNKLIKPDFSIFRVCDVGEDKNHREIAIAFFNGYGTEFNMFRPGRRDDYFRSDMDFLAQTTFILRQNNDAFLDQNWTPLIKTTTDNLFVNRWKSGDKTLYTILSMKQEGFSGELFSDSIPEGFHMVSLWRHEEMSRKSRGKLNVYSETPGWPAKDTGTRLEGSVDCIALFPELIRSEQHGDSVHLSKPAGGKLLLWKGSPSYSIKPVELRFKTDTTFKWKNILGYHEGKVILQYTESDILKDEVVLDLQGGKPWLVSKVTRTTLATSIPADMVLVPKSKITYTLGSSEDFIPYPALNTPLSAEPDSFLIDKYPVTNYQFFEFLQNSGYIPSDTTNFLHHWQNGTFKQGQDKYPVVWVSAEDMAAYAKWANKRLPTEAEWQLAAQGTDARKWPWGNEFHATWCNNAFDRPTPVDAFPKGASPFGAMDMVGNIWQATNDLYFNGTYWFVVIRGGSYYKPDSSWWYIQGGPQQLDKTQILLQTSQSLDRSATVGFRCVKDIDPKDFRVKK